MKAFVSEYNFSDEVTKTMKPPAKVHIFDTTLRDGEQTPGVSLTNNEKMHIAEQLSELGVSVIEAGFPINSKPEREVVKQIVQSGFKSKICGLSRVIEADIDACIDCDVDIIHTFVGTSDIHIKDQMETDRKSVKEKAVKAVKKIKDAGFECLFTPMDTTRTPFQYLIEVCKEVVEAGADRINVADTVGVMNPPAMRYLIGELRKGIKVPIEIHCHNDFGLAVSNSLAAVEAGVSYVQATINGLGERAGNTSLEQVTMALEVLYKIKTGIKTEKLTEISKLVERLTLVRMPPNTPIIGRNAFTHEAGIHAAAILKKGRTFEPITPEMVGQKSRIVMGKHTGRHAVQDTLKQLGYKTDEKQTQEITMRIKELAEKQKKISEDDIIAIADDVLGAISNKNQVVKLQEFSVFTSNKLTPVSTVILEINGEKKTSAASGIGAVDAASKAIFSALPIPITLKEYNLKAVTGGTDALANVLIRISDGDKNEYQAEATHQDIVIASINALIKGINKAMRPD